MNETMNSTMDNGDDTAAFQTTVLGEYDSRVSSEGFDCIHSSSVAVVPIPSHSSLTPTSFRISKTNYLDLERDIDEVGASSVCTASLPVTPQQPTPAICTTQSPRRCTTAPWDERNNWSKSRRHRDVRSANSACSNSSSSFDGSESTKLLQHPSRPGAMIRRNISNSSSSLSLSDFSAGEHELQQSDHDHQDIESRNPIFFSPRRRLNSLVHNSNRNVTVDTGSNSLSVLPVAVVSIPTLNDISTSLNHEDQAGIINTQDDDKHENNIRCRWCFFPPPPQWSNVFQRRNLMLLFLIATYTTFGLASPNIQKAASALLSNSGNGNVIIIDDAVTVLGDSMDGVATIIDIPFVTDNDAQRISKTTIAEITSSQLRGSAINGEVSSMSRKDSAVVNSHLSFARGSGGSSSANGNHLPNPPVFVYRRREMNDFYHQPALLQEETTVTTSWYLNCFVLLIIAIYYAVREHRRAILSCATTNCMSGSSGTVHNTHLL